MRIVDTCANPWFDTGAFVIELNEDEYLLLKEFAKITGRDIHDILRDAIYIALAKNLHLILPSRQAQTILEQTQTTNKQ